MINMKILSVIIGIVGSITLLSFDWYLLGGCGLVITLSLIDSMNPGMY